MSSGKRPRQKNFSDYEKNLSTELLKKHAILLSKSKDATTNKAKDRASESLHDEFNADASVSQRKLENLKCCVVNLMSKAKKEDAQRKRLERNSENVSKEEILVSETSAQL